MNISFENIDKVNGLLTMKVSKEDYEPAVTKSMKDFRKKAQLPGFRPGQVPMSILQKRFGNEVKAEELQKLVSKELFNYIREQKVNMLGEPLSNEEKQKPMDFTNDEEFEFVFDIALAPEMDATISSKDTVNYYDISAEGFVEKMYQIYQQFWNENRLAQAKAIGLTPIEVSTLASIVEEENFRAAEKAIIAGLYINRLHKGMLLQADPTVKFALGNFALRRVLNADLSVDSPYNTYKYAGLPPGPIRIPEASTLDSVLHYRHHDYLYMCAKEDLSGYHNFTASAAQHAQNAARYRAALNKQKIKR